MTQRMEVVEERTDSLETIFAAFMARTDKARARTDEAIERLERREQEGARERREMNERWGNLAKKMGNPGRGHHRSRHPPLGL